MSTELAVPTQPFQKASTSLAVALGVEPSMMIETIKKQCFKSMNAADVSDAQLAAFQDGKTTVAEVVAALGQPTSDVRSSDGLRVLGYGYMRAETSGAAFIPVVGAFAASASGLKWRPCESSCIARSWSLGSFIATP